MRKILIIILISIADMVLSNPIPIPTGNIYINEVQTKPIARFEVHLTDVEDDTFNDWSVTSSSGTLTIEYFTLSSANKIKVITDQEIVGNFSLNPSLDTIVLRNPYNEFVDAVYWPGTYSYHSFYPPDSGASAALACSTVYPGYPELPYVVYVWHTNRQPSFGQENPDIPYGVESNNPIKLKVTQPWLNAFPNPAKSMAVVSYSVPVGRKYKLCIYDLAGRLVSDLDDGVGNGKYSTAIWNGENKNGRKVAAGNYLVVLESNGQKHTKKITLIR